MTLGDRIAVMNRGVLQQVADPFTLYNQPANQFVAGFIGSPPINFFRARVDPNGALDAAGTHLTPPATWSGRLAGRRGQDVTLGIRPEDLTLEANGAGAAIPARADVREPLGSEVLVHWTSPVGALVSRIPGQMAPGAGESATLHFSWERLHLFDPASEEAIDA
ncbi:MAG TPA: TOBE domain-containing protein, partial [Dongiaceae bacterium]|nr:TOBE domain-containing protein [Dongiaceae bacterium]